MSFFNELKRRNVFRVGIAYVVGAWVLLQFTDVVGQILELPAWGGKIILMIIVVGFPITLLAAWAFELTPEGIKREREVERSESIAPQTGKKLNNVILMLMGVAIVYLLLDKFYLSQLTSPPDVTVVEQTAAEPAPVATETQISRQSIAVLPFDNRSRLEEDEFFVEGIHDDLLTNLARIGKLKVISRTSVLRYKDTEMSIPDIARELRVATVMEGAVQRSGDTVRINVQLIDAQTDEHLWAEIFDRDLTADNLFAIQTEISEKIASALKTTLSPQEQQRISDKPTENLAAYSAYLRGRQLEAERTSESLQKAMIEFERAVELDPDFAMAWVGISEVASLLIQYSTMPMAEGMERSINAAQRALTLNDQLGEPYLSLAEGHAIYNRDTEAEQAYKKAIELSPGYASAYQWYANFLSKFPARLRESLAVSEKARELDPMSSIIQLNHIQKLQALGRFEETETELNRLLERDPGFPGVYNVMAQLMSETGRFDEAFLTYQRSIDLDPGRITSYLDQGFTLLQMGDIESLGQLRARMEEIDDQHWSPEVLKVVENIYQHNYAAAIESGNWVINKVGPVPGFQNMLAYINLIQGDYAKAREFFERGAPLYWDRSSWRDAIGKDKSLGCSIADTMMHTGDGQMGHELLGVIISYVETELPRYVDYPERFGYFGCHVIAGDYEKALDGFEKMVEGGFYEGWWAWSQLPEFEPLRGNPRWQAGLAKIQKRNEQQREKLALKRAQAQL